VRLGRADRNSAGGELVLKVGWRHREAEHEVDGLRHWDGDGAVRCYATWQLDPGLARGGCRD
jgi:hypothetical protein